MELIPYGDSAVLLQLEQVINPLIHEQILAYYEAIKALNHPAILSLTPAYNSLLVYYNNQQLSHPKIQQILSNIELTSTSQRPSKTLVVPVCYEALFALDMDTVAKATQLNAPQIIELHQDTTYRVYMLGFLPGFAYLGTLPPALHCARKSSPRLQIPAGSVGLAGAQTGIYPSVSPGGWQIIGRTPIKLFDQERAHPFLVEAGDSIRFEAIDSTAFEVLETAINQQKWQATYE